MEYVWKSYENYESVYFTELHNDQEYYWPTMYRAGAVVVSNITSVPFKQRIGFLNRNNSVEEILDPAQT